MSIVIGYLLNPRVFVPVGVTAAVLALWLYVGAVKHDRAVAQALAASEAVEIAGLKIQARQTSATVKIDTAAASAQAATAATTSANLQAVRAYVSPVADRKCIIGSGAVRLLDAAAHDAPVSIPASGVPDADSGVALSELVADDIANAGAYHTLAERLKAWDDWYDAQAAIVR